MCKFAYLQLYNSSMLYFREAGLQLHTELNRDMEHNTHGYRKQDRMSYPSNQTGAGLERI